MPRMHILSAVEQHDFDSPPYLTAYSANIILVSRIR